MRLARYVATRLADPRRRARTVFWISLLAFTVVLAWRAVAVHEYRRAVQIELFQA